jgi:choline dehydrogenase-like flavoprotein
MHGAVMPDKVEAYAGAPQSIYSDAFVDEYDHRERVGYKLEVPPVHPVIMSAMIPGFGESHRQIMTRFPYLHVQIALLRDGFHPAAPGGRVVLGEGGQPVLDYEFGPALQEAARRAIETMGAIQWAAGAKAVLPLHGLADLHTSEPAWRQQLERLDYAPPYLRVVSAHVMGGCQMGEDQKQAVADLDGRFHQLDNLYVMDGSLFPTAVGTNPQLTIFAVVSRLTQRFMERHG